MSLNKQGLRHTLERFFRRHRILGRVLISPLILLAMIAASFFLIRLAPGSPFSEERSYPPAVLQTLRAKYHLDKPAWVQFGYYLRGLLRGDLGPSLKYPERSVDDIIREYWPRSFLLGITALCLALLAGVSCGIVAAWRRGGYTDFVVMSVAVLGISLPAFVIGPLIQLAVMRWLPGWPITGFGEWRRLVFPAITLALPLAARFARLTRAGFLEVLTEDYILTARAKGLPEWKVIWIHATRGGLLPVLGFLGPAIASITTGSLVVEQIFAIPGLGREFIASALNRDYTLVLGTVVVYGAMIIGANLLSDIAYLWLNPRLRREVEERAP
ncbi:MAG: ABC transporter permease [Lentisphaerae bacterium]|nr:MAG: ABC transporter permease [Lentisphaerota bacterium]